MKGILKKVAGIAVAASLVFGMFSCTNPSGGDGGSNGKNNDPGLPPGPTSPYSTCVVGDFVLKDGTVLSKDTDLTVDQKQNVAACEDLKTATAEEFETVAQKYPAFNFCRQYGEKNGLEGDLAKGWYFPTLAELYRIYVNKDAVDKSLEKADGSQFAQHSYWSCCQETSGSKYTGANGIQFSTGFSFYTSKSTGSYVCAVKAFN